MKLVSTSQPTWLFLILAGISGIISGLAITQIFWVLGLVGFVPILFPLVKYKTDRKQIILMTMIFSFFQSALIYGWIFSVVNNYTGSYSSYGIIVWFVFLLFNSFKYLSIFLFIRWYSNPKDAKQYPVWAVTLFTASLFVITDTLIFWLFRGFPWFYSFMGYTQSGNLYIAQLAELGGIGMLTFIVIVINQLITVSIVKKEWFYLILASVIVAVVHIYGWIRISTLNHKGEEMIVVTLVCDNTSTNLRWDERRVNEYVKRLFDLNRLALSTQADVIVWNESVIPWSFSRDDDFFIELMRQSEGYSAHHLISYFTYEESNPGFSSVSAYLVDENAEIVGRYDKSELLAGIEKPAISFLGRANIQLPFFNENSLSDNIENKDPKPISSKFGKIGVMICNESLGNRTAAILLRHGIDYMIVISNDNWFDGTALVKQHFYFSRIRAIENRIPLVVNANLGISGLIDYKGRLIHKAASRDPEVITFEVFKTEQINNYRSSIVIVFQLFIIIVLLLSILKRRFQ